MFNKKVRDKNWSEEFLFKKNEKKGGKTNRIKGQQE